MARPYRDAMEVVTDALPTKGALIPAGSLAMLGVRGTATSDPSPLILSPGYEYHLAEWVDEEGEGHWVCTRRVAARPQREEDEEADAARAAIRAELEAQAPFPNRRSRPRRVGG